MPAKVLLYEPSELYDAKFLTVGVLQLMREAASPVLPGALANVSFQLGGRTGVFLARVTDFRPGDMWPVLHIARPAEILVVESRRSLRFPVSPSTDMDVVLEHAGMVFEGLLHDISMGGISVSLREPVDWPPGAEVTVSMRYDGKKVRLHAQMVRLTNDTQVGLNFTTLAVGDDVAGLTHIVCELERRWLQR